MTVSVLLLLLFLRARADDAKSDKRLKESEEELFSSLSTCCCEVPSFDDLPFSASSAPPQTCSSAMMRPATTAAAAPRGAAAGRFPTLSALFGGPLRRARTVVPAAPARPLSFSSPVPNKPFPSSSPCDRDLCVAAAAASSSETASSSPLSTSDWWMDDADLWEEPRTKEEFDRALLCGGEEEQSSSSSMKPEIVLVAFYASWCKGCRRLHPELTALAEEASSSSSPLAGGRVKFVRVNYDRLRSVAAGAGATVLPFVAAYAPGEEEGGKEDASLLLGWQAVASKPGATRANLVAMLSGGSARPPRGKKWAFPKASQSGGNGSGGGGNAAQLPVLVDALELEAADRAREAEKLAAQASTAGLFERLAAIAGGGGSGSSGAGGASPPAAALPPPSTTSPSAPSRSHPPLARATQEQREAFLRSYRGDYNPRAEPVAAREIAPRLRGLVYLDATGGALYSDTQVDQMAADLKSNAFGNPHTGPASPPAALSSARIEEARESVLRWFNADPGEYACVFVPSATAALKTVGEAFAWSGSSSGGKGSSGSSGGGSEFRYLRENHNSVLGIRGYAEAKGARAVMMTEEEVERWLDDGDGESSSDNDFDDENSLSSSSQDEKRVFSLFAYPALDNFSGVLHPLDWAQRLREKGRRSKNKDKRRWFTLLDAAAFAPAHSLDLSQHSPDFVSLSFYKIFGLPTGVGALLVRREAFSALRRVYFGGGSTAVATAAPGFEVLKCEPVASFEVTEKERERKERRKEREKKRKQKTLNFSTKPKNFLRNRTARSPTSTSPRSATASTSCAASGPPPRARGRPRATKERARRRFSSGASGSRGTRRRSRTLPRPSCRRSGTRGTTTPRPCSCSASTRARTGGRCRAASSTSRSSTGTAAGGSRSSRTRTLRPRRPRPASPCAPAPSATRGPSRRPSASRTARSAPWRARRRAAATRTSSWRCGGRGASTRGRPRRSRGGTWRSPRRCSLTATHRPPPPLLPPLPARTTRAGAARSRSRGGPWGRSGRLSG